MISKELLSKVLGLIKEEVDYSDIFNQSHKINFDYVYREQYQYENRYELAHKCKLWATRHKCTIKSEVRWHDKHSSALVCHCFNTEENVFFEAESEPEAIFKACEWILNEY